ncbi:MAG TPA: branched-chain amino acid ABC transporter substrate-binding protein [Alphaproteobacteria bacterium]
MKRSLVGAIAGLAVALAAWSAPGPARGQQGDVVIASVGPMTGQYASFGEQLRRGATMAVEDINAKGGVLGRKLRLEVGDDACDPKQAVAVANQVASKRVRLVAGHFCSGSSIPASNVYAEENILQISPASTNPAFTERGLKNVFRVCGRDDQQGGVAGNFLADRFRGKAIAIIHDKTAYGKGLADETRKALNARGVKEVLYEAYTAGERDYSALVSRLKQVNADAIYVGGYHTEAGLIVRQMRQQGLKAVLVAGDALVTDEFWSIAGAAGEGTLMTFSPDPRKEPAVAALVEKFRRQGYEPEGYTLYSYASIEAWVAAVAKVGTTDTAKVAETLRAGKFRTVLGEIGFDAKGDVTAPGYVFYEWKGGKYDYHRP